MKQVPIVPYGGATSIEGQTLAPHGGVCIDMSLMKVSFILNIYNEEKPRQCCLLFSSSVAFDEDVEGCGRCLRPLAKNAVKKKSPHYVSEEEVSAHAFGRRRLRSTYRSTSRPVRTAHIGRYDSVLKTLVP
ncbi:hypothetical protein GW17_00026363 [Ensete ventricosum]|nr:hypothetical protein GW17_00026363 [Ensete ventricosum]